jgi:hypothetical protein
VPMSYVNAIQKETFWDDQTFSEIIRLLRVPKTGVPAVHSSTVTTLSWKEYLHIREEEEYGQYQAGDPFDPPSNDFRQTSERHSSGFSCGNACSLGGGDNRSDGSNRALPASPSDPALKKPEKLTVGEKWKLTAEYFVLEGGLSIGFHMQRSMGTLMLPEKLQPWNRNS